ncbi:uncharacterized protein MONOS_9266 [Monocercomonoides exilis]|uniref:uncharacterized protein n=1 Tax=Monocercomonoides exilis TaxID=2049356 RepID=UPI00355AA499|nr:hypothetical protein MONOS_9266 [Monocercomonoides exilis]|eukprot:MONOS_9266.1-p1 / transcript=MONOS_9266.1 / gene=MONOS_9266 / organism=Monocercomonoides_exilis_PA203 / gene_product=unspecified product / transcript_product=unspecified product / location=Mono_scaffold00376:10112-10564(-) / protein_length=117 / sequence_SO=supercontig / SO=protein_coding / is_pseudo=false
MIHKLQVSPRLSEEFAGEIEIHAAIPASIISMHLRKRKLPKVERKKNHFWPIVEIVCVVLAVLLLAIVAILAVRWKKVKNEADDLREIVNDNIRKDHKTYEMVTMEMSPEEQWRRE